MKKEPFLIFVNDVGENMKDQYIYEFIFSTIDNIKTLDGDRWDEVPASGRPDVPNANFISHVGILESDLRLDLLKNSDTFAIWDGVDGVIALAWENILAYESYPEKRLHFHFGLTMDEVKDKLYNNDLVLKFNKHE
jgi:hypothetical protein